MKTAPQDIVAHNAHEWKRLAFLLQQRQRPTILWVSCDTFPQRQVTFVEMKRRLSPRFQSYALSLETSAMSLTRYLQERLPAEVLLSEPGKWMVHLFDLESQLAQHQETDGAGLLASLNFERETLFRNFPFILVIWATPLATRRVQREAPDFWDWIANRFEFFTEPADLEEIDLVAEQKADWRIKTRDEARPHRLNRLLEQYEELRHDEADHAEQLFTLCERIGREYYLLPQYDSAIAFFQRALDQLEGSQADRREDQARVFHYLGRVYEETGELTRALVCFQESQALCQALSEANLHSESLKNSLAISYERLGVIFQAQGLIEQALESFQKETNLFEELFQANPHSESLKNSLAISYEKLGSIFLILGKYQLALEFFQEYNHIREELFKDNPHSEALKYGLAISYEKLGVIYQAQGKFEQAMEFFQKETELFKKLSQTNSHSYPITNGLAISYAKLGVLHRKMDQPAEARLWFDRAREIWQQLSEQVSIPEPKRYLEQVERDLATLP